MKFLIKLVVIGVGLYAFLMLLKSAGNEAESGRAALTVRVPESPVISEKQKFENAAKECWVSYERKSLTTTEKLSIAKFCEGLDQRAKTP